MAARFKVRTFRPGQGFSTRTLLADDEAAARAEVQKGGEKLVSIEQEGLRLGLPAGGFLRPRFSVALFARELLTLLEAGMTLVEAVDVLASKDRDAPTMQVLKQIRRSLSEGLALSVAMEKCPDDFSTLFVATVRSSEQTGALPEALQRYLAYVANINLVRNKLIAASIYPLILLAVSVVLTVFMAVHVVPRFSRIYSDMGERLPWVSRLMVGWAELLGAHGWLIAGLAVCTLMTGVSVLLHSKTRAAVMRALWRAPLFGSHARVYELARFTRTLSMLLGGGIAFVPALRMTSEVLHQPALRLAVQEASERISTGQAVSETFAATGLATDVGIRLLAVGERSGDLAGILRRVADMHDKELEVAIEWMSRLLEPVMMIVIGCLIGVVILLMYLPIFELANLMN